MDKPHRDLRAWKLGMQIVDSIYEITTTFPSDERFGLIAQLRRCAVSIPSNVAEGAARGSRQDFLRFLNMARGSLSELDTQIEISRRQDYLNEDDFRALDNRLTETDRVLAGLMTHLRNRSDD